MLLLLKTLRDYGALSITLIAPYFCYLRQDARLKEGEALSAQVIADMLSPYINRLITVDPHLRRIQTLAELFSKNIQISVVSALPRFIYYIKKHIPNPFIFTSEQAIADDIDFPHHVFIKKRKRKIYISSFKDLDLKNKTPIIIDDMITSGNTLIAIAQRLRLDCKGDSAPMAIATHAVFSESVSRGLMSLYQKILTTNTIPHSTNFFDIEPEILMKAQF